MKKLFFFFVLSAGLIYSGFSQVETAMDWTKNDCATGTSYNLFTQLDNGDVILCEYAMTCSTCISAANYMNEIYQDYAISDPGRVKFYLIDWNMSFTCPTMESWSTGLSCTMFLDGYDEVSYYGGEGMPTIVVLAGTDHHVYYDKLGYNHSLDDTKLRSAIDFALEGTESAINDHQNNILSAEVYPNPASNMITVSYFLNQTSESSISLINQEGQLIKNVEIGSESIGNHANSIDSEGLASGLYFIRIKNGNATESIKVSVIN